MPNAPHHPLSSGGGGGGSSSNQPLTSPTAHHGLHPIAPIPASASGGGSSSSSSLSVAAQLRSTAVPASIRSAAELADTFHGSSPFLDPLVPNTSSTTTAPPYLPVTDVIGKKAIPGFVTKLYR